KGPPRIVLRCLSTTYACALTLQNAPWETRLESRTPPRHAILSLSAFSRSSASVYCVVVSFNHPCRQPWELWHSHPTSSKGLVLGSRASARSQHKHAELAPDLAPFRPPRPQQAQRTRDRDRTDTRGPHKSIFIP